jgi:fructokinase
VKPHLCFGELLIDFLHFNTCSEQGFELPEMRQYPGGAPANVAAAIGCLGGNVRFLGQVGRDRFGKFLLDALKQMNVDAQFVGVHASAPTPLAFVFLDDEGERSFEFLRQGSADVLLTPEELPEAAFHGIGTFHFCSNTLTDPHIAETTRRAIEQARGQGALISFDINLRHNLWPGDMAQFDVIKSFFCLADVIKVSREEANWLIDRGFVADQWMQTAAVVWISDGGGPIEIIRAQGNQYVQPPAVTVVDTTAGGDAFTGGLLMALGACPEPSLQAMSVQQLEQITNFAAHCGALAVSRPGALPALPQWQEVEIHWPFEEGKH